MPGSSWRLNKTFPSRRCFSAACHDCYAPFAIRRLVARRPAVAHRWRLQRQTIKGTDPGKLKKIWFLGALLEQAQELQAEPG
eukprot:2810391-Pleurochrysis_carterae.AAC.4